MKGGEEILKRNLFPLISGVEEWKASNDEKLFEGIRIIKYATIIIESNSFYYPHYFRGSSIKTVVFALIRKILPAEWINCMLNSDIRSYKCGFVLISMEFESNK